MQHDTLQLCNSCHQPLFCIHQCKCPQLKHKSSSRSQSARSKMRMYTQACSTNISVRACTTLQQKLNIACTASFCKCHTTHTAHTDVRTNTQHQSYQYALAPQCSTSSTAHAQHLLANAIQRTQHQHHKLNGACTASFSKCDTTHTVPNTSWRKSNTSIASQN